VVEHRRVRRFVGAVSTHDRQSSTCSTGHRQLGVSGVQASSAGQMGVVAGRVEVRDVGFANRAYRRVADSYTGMDARRWLTAFQHIKVTCSVSFCPTTSVTVSGVLVAVTRVFHCLARHAPDIDTKHVLVRSSGG
jgi:hypothetical protein